MTSALVGMFLLGVALLVLLSRQKTPDLLSDPQRPRAGRRHADGGLVCGDPGVMMELPSGWSFSELRARQGEFVDPLRIDLRIEGMEEVARAFQSVGETAKAPARPALPECQLAERHAARLGRAQLVAMNAHLAKEKRGAPGFRPSREEH